MKKSSHMKKRRSISKKRSSRKQHGGGLTIRNLAEAVLEFTNGEYYGCGHGGCSKEHNKYLSKVENHIKKLSKSERTKVYQFLSKIAKEKVESDDLDQEDKEELLENGRSFLNGL